MKSKFKFLILCPLTALCLAGPSLAQETTESTEAKETAVPTDILIQGALSPLGLARIGKPVSIVTHKELHEASEATIGEVLSSQPGVSSSYFGPGASRPIIRGQSKQRVRVVENGLEVGDVSNVSDDHAVSMDPLSIQRVDILRGPSTLLYGSSAIGGVVNMIDDSIREEGSGKPLSGEVDLRRGNEADDERTGALTLNGTEGSINWHYSGFYRETGDIQAPDALLENSDTLNKGMKAGATYVFDKGYVGFALRLNDSNYGIPGEHAHHHEEGHDEHEEDGHDEDEHADEEHADVRINLDQIRFENRGEVRLDNSYYNSLRFGISYSDYQHKEIEGEETATTFNNNSINSRFELMHKHEDGFEGGIGSEIKYDDFEALGEEAFVPPSKTLTPALFMIEDYKLTQNLIWQIGARYEYSNVDPQAVAARDFNMFNASTGFVRKLDDKDVYSTALNFSFSERGPSSTELFANGPHLATQSFEIGDDSLDKERSFGSEIVLKKNTGDLTGSLSFFWQHYFDYINLTPNGEIEDELPVYLYGMDRARFWGFEAESDYALYQSASKELLFYGQIDYTRGDNLGDNDPLPRITPLRGKSGLRFNFSDFSTYFEGIFVDEQNRTSDFETSTSGYTLLNAGLSYQIPLNGGSSYELYLRGTNLGDEEARVHTSFLKDQVPLRGRSFMAGLSFKF